MSKLPLSYRELAAITTSVHPSWQPLMDEALATLDPDYLRDLLSRSDWLPGAHQLLNAFSIPQSSVKVVLFGESPYPRATSANGYAFWDEAVGDLWSATGLSKPVNRATSLRNILKMLLVADGRLSPQDTSQAAIAALDKSDLVQTSTEFFQHCLQQGFLLLNASLVLQDRPPQKTRPCSRPFYPPSWPACSSIALTSPCSYSAALPTTSPPSYQESTPVVKSPSTPTTCLLSNILKSLIFLSRCAYWCALLSSFTVCQGGVKKIKC